MNQSQAVRREHTKEERRWLGAGLSHRKRWVSGPMSPGPVMQKKKKKLLSELLIYFASWYRPPKSLRNPQIEL